MAIVSDELKYIFIMNPRTGCTATSELLTSELSGKYVPSEDIMDVNGKVIVQKKHTTIQQLIDHELIDIKSLNSYYKFTVIRNPFDSLVSLWTKKKYKYVGKKKTDPDSIVNRIPGYDKDIDFIQNHTFSEWITEVFSLKKNPTINDKHVKGTDAYFRFENLQDEFERFFLFKLKVNQKLKIPNMNKTKNREKNYRSYYSEQAKAVVEEKFSQELLRYNYKF